MGVLATLVAASFLVFTHPVSGFIFDGNEFNPQSFGSGTAITASASIPGDQWLSPRQVTGGDGFRRASYHVQGGVGGASISAFADAAAAWGTLDGTIFASGAWYEGSSVAHDETQFYDTCRVVSDTIPLGSPVVIHLNWTMRGTFSHLTFYGNNGLARLEVLRGVYGSGGVPYGWERLFLREWNSILTTSANEKGTIQLSDLSVGESFTFSAFQYLWGTSPIFSNPRMSGIQTFVTDFVSTVVPIVQGVSNGDVDASLVCNGLSEWKQHFAQWKARHCSPGIPEREMSVVFIPSRTKQAFPTLAFDEVVERIEYLEEYYYQQSMCSLVLNTFTIQDPNTDGWVELPRTKAEYDLIPSDGANNFVRSANIWLDAFFAAVAVEPVFLLNQQIGVDTVFVINTDSDIRARAFITKGLASILNIVTPILDILPSPVGTVVKTAKYLGCALGTVLDDLLLSCLLPTLFKQGSIIAADTTPTAIWAHELGHALFTFWDLYGTDEPFVRGDITGFNGADGFDHGWGLMAGAHNIPPPPIMTANREKAGWLKWQDITPDLYGDYALVALGNLTFGSEALRVKPPRVSPGADWFIAELRNPGDDVPRAPEQTAIGGRWDGVVYDVSRNRTILTDSSPNVRPFGLAGNLTNRFVQPTAVLPNIFQIRASTGSTVLIEGDQTGVAKVGDAYQIDVPTARLIGSGTWEGVGFDGTNTVLTDVAPDPAPFMGLELTSPAMVRPLAGNFGRPDHFRILGRTESTITIAGDQRGIASVGGEYELGALDTTPGIGQTGVVLYSKRDFTQDVPVCGSLRGEPVRALDTLMDHDFGSCLWKVTNPAVGFGLPDRFTLLPGTSYIDDPAGIIFSLSNGFTLSIQAQDPTSRIELGLQSEASATTAPASGGPAAITHGIDLRLPVDLHVFTPDGRHVGPNYLTGRYDMEIAGARAGGLYTPYQWISLPDDAQVSYLVDASRAAAAVQALGISSLEVNATVSVIAYAANGIVGQLQEPILYRLNVTQPSTGLIGIPTTTVDTSFPTWPPGSRLTASDIGPASLTLMWTPATDNFGIAGYRIYLGTSLLGTVAGDVYAFAVTGLTAGTTYTFNVEAADLAGNWGSDGPSVTVTTQATPSAPRALQASAGDGQLILAWQPPSTQGDSSITGYRLYRGTSPGGESFLVELGSVLTYTDTGLTNGVTYYYQVSAVTSIGEGPRSSEASATPTVPPDTTNPTIAITSPVSGTTLGSTSVTVSGTASDNVGVQRVELSSDGTNWIVATGTTSWSASLSLREGTNTIYIRVTDSSGNTVTETITVTVRLEGGLSPLALVTIAMVPVASSVVGVLLLWRRRRRRESKRAG